MLSPNQLERASHYFRRGYRDAFAGVYNGEDYRLGTFQCYDYEEGYRAGKNDRRWSRS